MNRRPGKEPAETDSSNVCHWDISDADIELQEIVSNHLVFPGFEEKSAHLKPKDLFVHSGVYLTKVTSFELR